ncbi:hypothetical protein INT43_004239 [Umbelopsis isabellina]|uniref:Serine protease n=1 Tax=Mortierella isabellina TaxID=91625 RepID=A0A8H7UBV8_MORIS|nr:hypothetical protein INT43_004239 [Umbelopsis isabellina]
MKYQRLLAVLLGVLTTSTLAQVSSSGQHRLLRNAVSTKVFSLPPLSNDALVAAEVEEKDAPLQFGKAVDVDILFAPEDDNVIRLDDGGWVWRTVIRSDEAVSLNLIFDNWWIPDGAEAYVYSDEQTIGAFKAYTSNKETGYFATVPVVGNEIVFEYFSPSEVKEMPKLHISKVVHGYKRLFDNHKSSSGSCNIDVACKDGTGWHDQARSVAVILTDNNQKYCTGAMVNNLRQDGKQYFLTANHCTGWNDMKTHLVMFNYERTACGDGNSEFSTSDTAHGLNLLATYRSSDFALLEVMEPIPDDYQVFLSGWSAEESTEAPYVTIHHPSGDLKKISHFDGDVQPACWSECPQNMHWEVERWTTGTTEPGSSGSPLFESTGRIIGQLHGGVASCWYKGYDRYGAIKSSWDAAASEDQMIKTWLDPDNTGKKHVDGGELAALKKSTIRREEL